MSGCCPGRWISIQGHPMSRPAFSHRHTLGQFRSPIQSTRHTQLINRSPPAAEACGVRLFASEGCKEISGGQHASPPCPCDGCLCVDVRRHLQLPSDRARSGGHMQPDHKRGCVSGEMKREGCQLPHLRYFLGSTMEIQHWAQLSLARGPVKRCRQLGDCSTVELFFASLSPPICGTFQLSGGFAMMDMSVFENLEEGQEKRGWLMTDIQVFCFPQYQYL